MSCADALLCLLVLIVLSGTGQPCAHSGTRVNRDKVPDRPDEPDGE